MYLDSVGPYFGMGTFLIEVKPDLWVVMVSEVWKYPVASFNVLEKFVLKQHLIIIDIIPDSSKGNQVKKKYLDSIEY